MSLRFNVLAAIVTATAALVLALILLEGPLVDYRQITHTRSELKQVATDALEQLEGGATPDAVADQLGALRAARVLIYDERRVPVGDTAFDGREIVQRREPVGPETLAAIHNTGTTWRVGPGVDGEANVFVALAKGAWSVRVSRPYATVRAVRESIRELIFAGGLIAILAAALLSLVITNTMVGPIERLTATADLLAQGDLSARTRLGERGDEIGRIGRSLDKMANRLEKQLRKAQAGERRLRTMLDSMVEGVFVTDKRGRISLCNEALETMVDESPLGKKASRVISNPRLKRAILGARRGVESTVELSADLKGEEHNLHVQLTPLPQKEGVVAVVHDVTDLKRSDRIRSDFVANASHELRTPLTAIRGFAETLRNTPEYDASVSDRFLDAILRHTNRLQRLVDDLLALSRAESQDQEFELGAVNVGPIVNDIATGLEAQAGQKGITLKVDGIDELPEVFANAWALDHVMVNLIDNAVKYTPDNGEVTVAGFTKDESVVLEVHDTGPGIDEDQRARIFERFYRVDAGRARTQGGTGLGLAIVKHLVLRMGGQIEVDSEPGQGAVFRVILPTDVEGEADLGGLEEEEEETEEDSESFPSDESL